jgi:two-component system alkaline phosphatase synthesis response regulator PhoP
MSGDASETPARKTVLVVDDALSMLRLHSVFLEHAGFRVLTASSGPEGLESMASDVPDLVVLDYMMPEMDGPEFLRRMRSEASFAGVLVLVLTATDEQEHISAAFEAGGNDYLSKPVDRRTLVARVKAMVDGASPDRRVA